MFLFRSYKNEKKNGGVMLNKKFISFIITGLILMMSIASVSAQSIAPDRAQQILDLIAVECQNINDYSVTAS